MVENKLLKIKKFVLDVIFPPCCLGCGKNLEDSATNAEKENHPFVCDDCFKNIPINNALYCPICFARIAGAQLLCSHAKKSNLSYLGFAANYENELLKNIIWNLKYRFVRDLSSTLALILYHYLKSFKTEVFNSYNWQANQFHKPPHQSQQNNLIGSLKNNKFLKYDNWRGGEQSEYIIVPVPLHKSRLKWRGFNQSELIAKNLSGKLNIPFVSDVLVRVKKTDDQTKLDKEKRLKNVRDAFKVKNPELIIAASEKRENEVLSLRPGKITSPKSDISGKNIFLLDDVYTSGATIEEAAKTLKQAGAKKIIGLVIAKG